MSASSCSTVADAARFARILNNRPGKTLGHMKPSERLAELATSTVGPPRGGTAAGSRDRSVQGR